MRELLLRQSHAACRYGYTVRLGLNGACRYSQYRLKSSATSSARGINVHQNDTSSREAANGKQTSRSIVSHLNTTRPAPLTLPEAPHPLAWPSSKSLNPSKWDYKYLFALGKAFLAFYKTGFMNVWNNRKTMKLIREKLKGTAIDDAARHLHLSNISYNEYELMLRTRRDLNKLIPFALIFAACGEFTPLVVLALGSAVVPGTCVVPKQQSKDLQKMLERDTIFNQEMAKVIRYQASFDDIRNANEAIDNRTSSLPAAALEQVTRLEAYRAGAYPSPERKGMLTNWFYLPRSEYIRKKRGNELLSTAILVQREGGWSKRSPLDMWEWGNKYGLYKLHQYTRQALARGENPVSDKMKAALLPTFERETNLIVNSPKAPSLSEGDRWIFAVRTILNPSSPDSRQQRADIEIVASKLPTQKEGN